MKLTFLAVVAGLGLVLTGCTSPTPTARDNSPAEPPQPMPTAAPTPTGLVQGQGTVIDVADETVLCLGPVAESYPPQCGPGPGTVRLTDWKWRRVRDHTDTGSGVKFGSFMVQGNLDGDQLAVVGNPIPLALYDPAVVPDDRPCVAPDQEPEQLLTELADLPGSWGGVPGVDNKPCVVVEVLFDDGTLQAWVDDTYGAGAVLVNSALVEVSN